MLTIVESYSPLKESPIHRIQSLASFMTHTSHLSVCTHFVFSWILYDHALWTLLSKSIYQTLLYTFWLSTFKANFTTKGQSLVVVFHSNHMLPLGYKNHVIQL